MHLLIAAAFAYESPPVEIFLADEADLFSPVEIDTGWLPSGSPVAVAFRIQSEGGAYAEMEGESQLTWPTALTHSYVGTPGTGYFSLDSTLTAGLYFKVDWSGFYYEDSIAEESVAFAGETTFDPYLLGREVEASAPAPATELFNLEYEPITSVSVYVKVNWRPDVTAGFSGVRWTTDGPASDDTQVIELEGAPEVFAPPGLPSLDLDAVYTARWSSLMSIVLTPTMGVCVPFFGCYDVASFDVPLDLVNTDFEQDFDPVELSHPLPLMQLETTACDFGEVLVGQIATCEILMSNNGYLPLEGSAGIMGAGEFSAFPETLYAMAETSDGLVVTFAPTAAGEQAANLVLNSSDPGGEALQIPLTGIGVEPEEEEVTVIPSEVGVCGCRNPDKSLASIMILPLAALAWRRRRA